MLPNLEADDFHNLLLHTVRELVNHLELTLFAHGFLPWILDVLFSYYEEF
jgi:hypothetical protein